MSGDAEYPALENSRSVHERVLARTGAVSWNLDLSTWLQNSLGDGEWCWFGKTT